MTQPYMNVFVIARLHNTRVSCNVMGPMTVAQGTPATHFFVVQSLSSSRPSSEDKACAAIYILQKKSLKHAIC